MPYISVFAFQRHVSQVLEKDISWVVKLASLGEELHTFQSSRKRIHNFKFSKVDALRKGRSGAYSQEGICLSFSQAEGNVSPSLPQDK